ncbi:hypothetical protein K9L63_03835, partial [Candidatus Gracilibacteria bacterium]|nr:hypothetical protein [Candidatus Gracilibacteria bacterium]
MVRYIWLIVVLVVIGVVLFFWGKYRFPKDPFSVYKNCEIERTVCSDADIVSAANALFLAIDRVPTFNKSSIVNSDESRLFYRSSRKDGTFFRIFYAELFSQEKEVDRIFYFKGDKDDEYPFLVKESIYSYDADSDSLSKVPKDNNYYFFRRKLIKWLRSQDQETTEEVDPNFYPEKQKEINEDLQRILEIVKPGRRQNRGWIGWEKCFGAGLLTCFDLEKENSYNGS